MFFHTVAWLEDLNVVVRYKIDLSHLGMYRYMEENIDYLQSYMGTGSVGKGGGVNCLLKGNSMF